MELRHHDNTGIDTSILGFGCMRLPTLENGEIDEAKAFEMIDTAYKSGVNYYDTAYVYHGGKSESFTGRALEKYERSSYYIATKLPCWEVHSLDDAKRLFNEQLENLNRDYIDFYLLHALGRDRWEEMKKLGVVEYCEELQREGKIKYFGFSFHDEYEVFEDIISYRKWDFCQIQLNYMDTEEQAGIKGYKLAEKLGVPVIVMEPIKGGSLANLADDISEKFKSNKPDWSIASWAMRWVGSLSNVKVILSGMSTMEQVKDNIATFTDFSPLTNEEISVVEYVAQTLRSRVNNGCTGCNYCMPCPAGVNIPYNFSIWNNYGIYQNKGGTIWEWNNSIDKKQKAENCINCGKCEKVCPQKIQIRKDLATLQAQLDDLHWKFK